jgi:hypothetical protein
MNATAALLVIQNTMLRNHVEIFRAACEKGVPSHPRYRPRGSITDARPTFVFSATHNLHKIIFLHSISNS